MPAIAPVLRPSEESETEGAVIDVEDEDGITEDAGLPDGRGDSAGKGSPRKKSATACCAIEFGRLTRLKHVP
jgi:hypothetical protein